jgi:hypothetical protein
MKAAAVGLGVVMIVVALWDCFEVLILPRRVTRRLRPARLFYVLTWPTCRYVALLLSPGKGRERVLATFGPLSLIGLFACWALALVVGFALTHWGLDSPLNKPQPEDSVPLGTYLYLSGTTFFTLGYGDVTPSGPLGRFLTVVEAGLGFGFLAVVIGYLPVLYQAFSRREATISLLDARAGSPPSAAEFLLRLAQGGNPSAAVPILAEWERWAAELLESHLSFPVLSYYRSQHDNQSWLGALTFMLDACALILTGLPGGDIYQAQLTFAMARHAAVDLAMVFRTSPLPFQPDRLPRERLELVRERLREAGLNLRSDKVAEEKLAELRQLYEPFVNALGEFLLFAAPPVVPEKPPVDNWQSSAWMRRAAGLHRLPAEAPDEHDD